MDDKFKSGAKGSFNYVSVFLTNLNDKYKDMFKDFFLIKCTVNVMLFLAGSNV